MCCIECKCYVCRLCATYEVSVLCVFWAILWVSIVVCRFCAILEASIAICGFCAILWVSVVMCGFCAILWVFIKYISVMRERKNERERESWKVQIKYKITVWRDAHIHICKSCELDSKIALVTWTSWSVIITVYGIM